MGGRTAEEEAIAAGQPVAQLSRRQLFGKFLLGELAGRPRIVNIEVTLRCNARCSFCNHRTQSEVPELSDYRPVVRQLDPIAVNLTGGEPLLRRDIVSIVASIKQLGPYYVSLLTNGARLTLERARALRAHGLDGLSISLNHLSRAHDEERGIAGLSEHLNALIPELPRLGFRRVDLNTVILESNLDELIPLAARARQWGVGLSLSCYSSTKTGDDSGQVHRLGLLLRTIDELRRLKREGWPISSSDWYLRHVRTFHLRGGVPGCRAGRRTVHVTPDGYVKPCPDLPAFAHYTTFQARRAPRQSCTSCWYRCRGEAEAPLTPGQVLHLASHWPARAE